MSQPLVAPSAGLRSDPLINSKGDHGTAKRALISAAADRDFHAQASSVLLVHTDSNGLCGGCMEFAARLSWWPCLQVELARAAMAALTEPERPSDESGPMRERR